MYFRPAGVATRACRAKTCNQQMQHATKSQERCNKNKPSNMINVKNNKPSSVALIGCGPSGMFFLHALATRRAKLEREGNAEAVAALPVVTCFERASGPGGVWRADRFKAETGDAASTNMYEALWTNGPKEMCVLLH